MNASNIPRHALVLVCDGRKALFLRNRGSALAPELVIEATCEQDNPPSREQGTDRPGRRAGGAVAHRSAMDEGDAHSTEEARFAAGLADRLYRDPPAGRFEHLWLVAAPGVLGTLRQHLHVSVAQRVIAEIPKTLTQHSVDDIQSILTST